MAKIAPAPLTRPLSDIAREIRADYAAHDKPVHYSAEPYVLALSTLRTFDDHYFSDPAASIVRYALSNLRTWRGPVAKRVKDELRAALAAL